MTAFPEGAVRRSLIRLKFRHDRECDTIRITVLAIIKIRQLSLRTLEIYESYFIRFCALWSIEIS